MTTALSDVLEGPLECPACANPCHGIPWLSRPEPGKPIQPSEGVKSVPKDRGGSGGRGLPILRGVGVGYGWAQTEFLHTCDACGLAFGKDALCVRKLGNDLAPALKNGSLLPFVNCRPASLYYSLELTHSSSSRSGRSPSKLPPACPRKPFRRRASASPSSRSSRPSSPTRPTRHERAERRRCVSSSWRRLCKISGKRSTSEWLLVVSPLV